MKSKDEVNKVARFHVGTTAWSWGYNMVLKAASGENNASNVSIEIARSLMHTAIHYLVASQL